VLLTTFRPELTRRGLDGLTSPPSSSIDWQSTRWRHDRPSWATGTVGEHSAGHHRRTDGIPLFVEEMTKAVVEAGSETAAVRAVAAIRPRH
jgi:hypothetical protein